ncbi:MAG: portal protein [Candidatus Hermodarchaeia archaeon]|jgi:hypothetical protein
MPWWDFYKLWTFSFEKGPLEKQRDLTQAPTGAGVGMPEAIPDLRGEAWGGGPRGMVRLHDSNDFIDLSTVTNRLARYKEYERLRNLAEIEMAMTVIAEEACVMGRTKVATAWDGYVNISKLAKDWEKNPKPFLVYAWDFNKDDYTLAWAYEPRFVKRAKTVRVTFHDGTQLVATDDHRVLMLDGTWMEMGGIQVDDKFKAFHKVDADRRHNKLSKNVFSRIFTYQDGWKSERQFIDEWRTGEVTHRQANVNKVARMLEDGASVGEIEKATNVKWSHHKKRMEEAGFTLAEHRQLSHKYDFKRVVNVESHDEVNVYDLSVKDHENFCTDSAVVHNCQIGDNGHVFEIKCKNQEVKKELEWLLFSRKMLNLDRRSWNHVKRLCIFGDGFFELLTNPDNPKDGILKMQELPPDSMYRIETTKCRLVEFQQGKDGPDYQALTRNEVTKATEADLQQATAIRFAPKQVIHFRIGDDRKAFYPYGQSLIEPARGPAHQLRLMEDAMVVYRLTRAPERRIFYIDVGKLPPFKAEAFIEKMKDQFRKKKVARTRGGGGGANVVEERWHAPAADEDYWLPIRPNSNTRIDTLQGAQNLGEIDDALYFRNKLFTALNFPQNYFNNSDPQQTRVSVSSLDVRFARMIERIQAHYVDGIVELCERHLELRGFPDEAYEDLELKMTPPSDWREMSRSEVLQARLNFVTSLKGAMIMADYDLLTRYMNLPAEEVEEIIARNTIQKLQELKLQIIGQNPPLMGVGVPGAPSGEQEIGAVPGGPSPMLGGEGTPPEGMPGAEEAPPEAGAEGGPEAAAAEPAGGGATLPEPDVQDIKRFDLEIKNYSQQQDAEDIDYSEEE